MSAFDWQFPYASYRKPILARNIVATSQPLAAQAGPAHAAARRQRRGRGAGHRHRADGAGAGFQRHRQRRLRHRLGRQEAARPQRLRPLARRLDAGVLQGPQDHAAARLERGERARLRLGLGRRCRSASASCLSPTCSSRRSATRATAIMVSPTIARQWANQVPELKAQPGFSGSLHAQAAARRCRAKSSASPTRRRRWN